MRGWVIEGVTGSGKTTLLGALQRALVHTRPAATKLVLSEHYTDRVLEDVRRRGGLTVTAALDHLDGALAPVRALAALERAGKFAGRGGDGEVYVVLERFAASHLAYLPAPPTAHESARVVAMYAETVALGLRPLLLRIAPERLGAAVLDTRRHRTSAWRSWLASHGDDAAVAAHFARWQAALVGVARALPPALRPEELPALTGGDPEADRLARRLVDPGAAAH